MDHYELRDRACIGCPVVESKRKQLDPSLNETELRDLAFEQCIVGQIVSGLVAEVMGKFFVDKAGRVVGYVSNGSVDCSQEKIDNRYGSRGSSNFG